MAQNQAVSFGLLLAGGVALTAALKGDTLSNVLQGKSKSGISNQPASGSFAGTVGNAVTGAAGAVAGAASNIGTAVKTGLSGAGPFGGKSVNWGRTDQGVDVSTSPGTPIYAIAGGKVTAIQPNWYSGQPLMAITSPGLPHGAAGIYYAEQISPSVKVGDTVQAGQQIGTFASSGTAMEIGFTGDAAGTTLAVKQGNTGDASHNNAPAGIAFRAWLKSLGVSGI